MASIRTLKGKNGNKYKVLFFVNTPSGRKQRSGGTYEDYNEAVSRKKEVEYLEDVGKLKVPDHIKVEEFFNHASPLIAAERNWTPNYYKQMKSHLRRHVFSVIGKRQVKDIKPLEITKLFVDLKNKRVASSKYQKTPMEERPFLSASLRKTVFSHVQVLFEEAVKWEVIEKTPVTMQKPADDIEGEISIWDDDTTAIALHSIDSPLLHLAVHIGLFTTSREGEIVGLTLDKILLDDLKIKVNVTMQRMDKKEMEELNPQDIVRVFPQKMQGSKSFLVLKATKTKNSKTVDISPELKTEILYRMQEIQKNKLYYGNAYQDYGLLLCYEDGSPIEPGRLSRWFLKWNRRVGSELGIPPMKFHWLRHTGTTMYMELTGNNVKQVQSITGHTSPNMILKRYYHVRDPKRTAATKMAQKLRPKSDTDTAPKSDNIIVSQLLDAIKSDPELQKKLAAALNDK